MTDWIATFKRGLSIENPLTILMIGLCATLAVSTKFEGAFFMGLAVIFVLTMSSMIISALRRVIPEQVRIPIFIVVIASFVTIVDLTMHAFLPPVYNFLGVWIPLIVVNCVILGRAEAFAYHNSVSLAVADGLGMGTGYSFVIIVLATFREFVGSGEIVFMNQRIVALPPSYQGPGIVLLFPGAFIIFGFMIAGARWVTERQGRRVVETSKHCTIEEGRAL